jgi:hypothetical protein
MKLFAYVSVLAAVALAQVPHQQHSPSSSEYAEVLEDPSRDAWQKPHDVVIALGLKPADTIADIGAGTGYFARRFAHHAGKVFPGCVSSTINVKGRCLMTTQTSQQAWIHGLPGETRPGGIPIEVLDFHPPWPASRQLSLVLRANLSLANELRQLFSTRTRLGQLTVVIRKDPRSQQDTTYNMTDAAIGSVGLPVGSQGGWSVNIHCSKLQMIAGISMNPGPPPDAPPVRATGMNRGWIHGLHESARGMPVDVIAFTPPSDSGQLAVTFGNPELSSLLKPRRPFQQLILVLPDRARKRYVEFKLWDANVAFAHGRRVVFESDIIECFKPPADSPGARATSTRSRSGPAAPRHRSMS